MKKSGKEILLIGTRFEIQTRFAYFMSFIINEIWCFQVFRSSILSRNKYYPNNLILIFRLNWELIFYNANPLFQFIKLFRHNVDALTPFFDDWMTVNSSRGFFEDWCSSFVNRSNKSVIKSSNITVSIWFFTDIIL